MTGHEASKGRHPTARLPSAADGTVTVRYLSSDQPVSSVPETLESRYDMRVSVTESLDPTQPASERGDCLVVECDHPQRIPELLAGVRRQIDDTMPVLLYGGSNCTPGTTQIDLLDHVDEFVSKRADSSDRRLLTRRIRSIVERHEASNESRWHRRALEQMGHGVLIADQFGTIEYVNEAFEQMLGYDRSEVAQEDMDLLKPDRFGEQTFAAISDCLERGETWSGEIRVAGKGSESPEVNLTVAPFSTEGDSRQRIIAVGEDISDRVAYEEELEDARRKYRTLIDVSPDPIFIADASSGTIVETNDAAADLLDMPVSEILGLDQAELHPKENRDRYRTLFRNHATAQRSVTDTFPNGDPLYIETGAGEHVPVEIAAKRVEVGDRELIQGHFRNISARRRRKRKLEGILNALPDVAVVLNDDAEYVEILTGGDELHDEAATVSAGSHVSDVLPAQTAEVIEHTVHTTLESGSPQREEFRLPREGEKSRCYEARTAVIENEIFGSAAVVLLARDISDRKRRERSLRSFREAVDQAGHVVMITDTDGAIEYVNPAFEAVTGYSESFAIGKDPSLLKSGETRDSVYEDLWSTIQAGNVWEGELINERSDGELYYIEQTIAPIHNEDDEIEQYVAINKDITDRKEYEKQLQRERERLDDFAKTVAHDLRNPLSIATAHLELYQSEETDTADDLTKVHDALDRMNVMIDEILALSRQGRTARETEPVDMPRIINTAWNNVQTDDASVTVDPGLATFELEADPGRLMEVLENLFRNAADHAGSGAEVTVGFLEDPKGFYVADDGPGIPQDDRRRIFDSGFTTADNGTGFGLPIVNQIAGAHEWEIRATDSVDGGARFEILTECGEGGEGGQ